MSERGCEDRAARKRRERIEAIEPGFTFVSLCEVGESYGLNKRSTKFEIGDHCVVMEKKLRTKIFKDEPKYSWYIVNLTRQSAHEFDMGFPAHVPLASGLAQLLYC